MLDQHTISTLRSDVLKAERLGKLTDIQLDIIRSNHWFKILVPKDLGGLGLSLPEVLKLEETLAWIDGSIGWVVTLCAGAGWFIEFADKDFATTLLSDPNFCIAGSGGIGTAMPDGNGFRINGTWRYASGSLHATAFTMNCRMANSNEVVSFFLLPSEVTVKHTWNSMGMVATGSHSFEVRDQYVEKERVFIIERDPFKHLADTTLAVNLSGMALRFIELAEHDASEFNHQRKIFFEHLDKSSDLVKASREIVNKLYPLCGLAAADKDTEINRVWRNFHTASQHSIFNRK